MKRKIIKIDESKCTGCGVCVPDCRENALKIINGKLKLTDETLCDGLGACLGACPFGALSIEERESKIFDHKKADENMKENAKKNHKIEHTHEHAGCPGMKIINFKNTAASIKNTNDIKKEDSLTASELSQWPIQLKLLNPNAPYFKEAHILITADCVPFSYANFHSKFLKNKILIIFCPKLDSSYEDYVEKLAEIFKINDIKSVTIIHMEVPCCSATTAITEEALKKSGKNIIIKDYTISLRGEII
ncbi:4Fe-4S ferredoxin iron-sulfur binding domain-containing protein [Candidatus Omnitrophus magneticus]|uniref:4Fe-4S ferredoxin iron-sulfur binding domain-containing protein n=1 Tax=Candidatus Omnitrophus magneticus TaxID=1609969 RepID=A0A0F0CT96_9BACT|nr:4Fe-4S ferredoxin iron-sulfur binding domain-containing protein [Candidatus Omnitrophus magneticus]